MTIAQLYIYLTDAPDIGEVRKMDGRVARMIEGRKQFRERWMDCISRMIGL